MRIRRKWLRDLCSIIFSGYYLVAAEQADTKVRNIRGALTLDHLRVSWNKGTTPYLGFASALLRPRLMKYPPREIRIPRPSSSDYNEPVHGWLYFDGPLSALKTHTKLVLDIPGGGFVAMDPRTNDDKLFGWAGKTGLPILSLDYQKAPEFPYPYALNECFDVYQTIVASRGRCVGLSGETMPKVVITGDSAGGNLATGTMLMIVEAGSTETRQHLGEAPLPVPDGLILMYPGLDLNIGNWMSDEQMALIQDRKMRKSNKNMLRQKSTQYAHLTGTPHPSDDEGDEIHPRVQAPKGIPEIGSILSKFHEGPSDEPATEMSTASTSAPISAQPPRTATPKPHHVRRPSSSHKAQPMQTRLAMSSMISYFNDRILTPEMMRAMIILYIGPHNRPDFSQDYLLSPVLAPDMLLARFPKVWFLTGERDPLVDDTAIFAGRLRRAKILAREQEEKRQPGRLRRELDETDICEVILIPGISHGFLQFAGVYPEGWEHIYRCGRWIEDCFARSVEKENNGGVTPGPYSDQRFHFRSRTGSSGDEDFGLEMSMTPRSKANAPEGESAREKTRKRKERLLTEHLEEKKKSGREGELRKDRKGLQRKKSMVSLASSDDLLGRRMLGLAGPLTGNGQSQD